MLDSLDLTTSFSRIKKSLQGRHTFKIRKLKERIYVFHDIGHTRDSPNLYSVGGASAQREVVHCRRFGRLRPPLPPRARSVAAPLQLYTAPASTSPASEALKALLSLDSSLEAVHDGAAAEGSLPRSFDSGKG